MLTLLVLAFGLGVVAGLRTFTAPAAVLLARGSVAGYFVAAAALAEYVGDALPKAPSRTMALAVAGRAVSGAFSGYTFAAMHGGPTTLAAVAGIAGSLVGTYGGHALRIAAIPRIGALPAALAEDVVAIGLAVLFVTR
jgi:uncharacterized membrane protein